jgi:Asp-tRNA(Asn)/Glu-tRNA(Gln) amidotransferase A subunit family amidase
MDSVSQKSVVSATRDDVLGAADAVEVARRIRDGDIHATEAVEAALVRAEQVNPMLPVTISRTKSRQESQVLQDTTPTKHDRNNVHERVK